VRITASSDPAKAMALHHDAHAKCFIANSVSCPVSIEPSITQ
jgi:organic hydroperoxide reductase OsmC/OhrA